MAGLHPTDKEGLPGNCGMSPTRSMAKDPQRNEIIRKALESKGLAALFCFTPASVLLLSGYWPVMGSSVAFFQRDGRVTVVLPEDELDLAMATSDAELVAYKPGRLNSTRTPAEALIEPLRSLSGHLHIGAGDIGTVLQDNSEANPYLSLHHFNHTVTNLVAQACPAAKLVAADDLLRRLQAVNTTTEVDLIRRAANLARVGFAAATTAIAAGRREDEVAADIESAFSRVANNGFERGHGHFFCMSGPNSTKAAGAFARTRTRVLQEGDIVMIHANTTGDGYWTDISRTYVVGTPNDRQESMTAAIAEAREAALKAVAPGVKAKAVDAAARDVLARHGFRDAFKHSTGHGVGFAAADGNALPRIHPASPDVLEEGMTFNIEPAIYIEGIGGMRHCDVVSCAGSGPKVLTDF
jgi:Xaa-Pro aminopeptidase